MLIKGTYYYSADKGVWVAKIGRFGILPHNYKQGIIRILKRVFN